MKIYGFEYINCVRRYTNEIAEEASRCQGLFPPYILEKALGTRLIPLFKKSVENHVLS